MTLHDLKRWRESSLQRVQVPLPRALFLSRSRLQRGILRTLQPCAQRLRLTAPWAPPAPAWGFHSFLSSCLPHCYAAASKVRSAWHFLQPIFSESVETKYSQLALYFRRWQPLQLHWS